MMERRSALTIPFTMKKDNLMENPLRINMACLSSQCGKVERQVPWTAFAGCKVKQNSPHKNGSVKFDCSRAAMTSSDMSTRKPLLILTDVLKTTLGKAYMDRMREGQTGSVGEPAAGRRRTAPVCSSDRKPKVCNARNNRSKSLTPRGEQKPAQTSSESSRFRLKRRLRSAGDKEEKDEEEVVRGKDSGNFAEVVDCGLSVSWDHSEDPGSSDEYSPADIKDSLSESEEDAQHSVKRKRKDVGSQCNGTSSPKRHRESVLRLTGDDGRDGGEAPAAVCLEESVKDGDVASADRSILQFNEGGDDQSERLVAVTSPSVKARDIIRSPKLGKENAAEATPTRATPSKLMPAEATPSEPIVLSSDEEESADVLRRSMVQTRLVMVGDSVIQGLPKKKVLAKQPDISDLQDMEVLRVIVPDGPRLMSSPTDMEDDYTKIDVAFSALHCGGYRGISNGNMMIENEKCHIPLKDAARQKEVTLSFDKKELKRYSVWDEDKLEAEKLRFRDGERPHQDALLFFLSETAAAAVHGDLSKLGGTNAVKASQFILLTLREPLVGVKGALLRSTLDIECLNSMAQEQATMSSDLDSNGCLEDFLCPILSLEESINLMERMELNSDVLSLLGVTGAGPELNVGQDSPRSDQDDGSPARSRSPVFGAESLPVLEPQTLPDQQLETSAAPEQDEATQLKPEKEQAQVDPKQPPEKKEEPAPVYTLCHRRTKASYSVSLCKPDSNWIKYKHLGLSRRLIQFPPPPLKGGITVTMEDLQCLDSGQYLNDVIIDFYLKYLLQNAPASMVERSHIFSSFFYKQLTRRDNASEGGSNESCQRQRRHQRVKTWTRHVDIFKKDFLFVPVNQEAHWYLVVICFPGLDEPKLEDWTCPTRTRGTGEARGQEEVPACENSNQAEDASPSISGSKTTETQRENPPEESTKDSVLGPVNCTELTCQKNTVCKRPCILIMDSLKVSLHERVFKLLREYLQTEWEVRQGSTRDFGPDQMKSSHCKVPLQDNSSDCGLYLLQYVECFLKDPVVHFELPLCLERWFPRQQVRRKRDNIRDLILYLYRLQNLGDSPCS